ncbi:MAG: hypothetical protein Q8P67_14445, partial [archaeon]|nr:hypothetical protein [archaeon]
MSDGSADLVDDFYDPGSDFDFDTFGQDGDVFDEMFDDSDGCLDDHFEHCARDESVPQRLSVDIHPAVSDDTTPYGKRISSSPSSIAANAQLTRSASLSKGSSHLGFTHPSTRVGNGPQFQVHEESEVRSMCNAALNSVIEFYPVSRIAALHLLKQNKWDSEKVINHLIDSASPVPGATADSSVAAAQSQIKKQKLSNGPRLRNGPSDGDSQVFCLICFDSVELEGCWSSSCGHLYCRKCWANYFNVSIHDGEM